MRKLWAASDGSDDTVECGMVTEDGDDGRITVLYENGSMDRYDAGPGGGLDTLLRVPNYVHTTEQDLL
jgi:hypothetical protein